MVHPMKTLALLLALAGIARGQALPYYSIYASTTQGEAFGNISGPYCFAASSNTYQTCTATIDGTQGAGLFTGLVNAGAITLGGSTGTITNVSSITASAFFGDGSHLSGGYVLPSTAAATNADNNWSATQTFQDSVTVNANFHTSGQLQINETGVNFLSRPNGNLTSDAFFLIGNQTTNDQVRIGTFRNDAGPTTLIIQGSSVVVQGELDVLSSSVNASAFFGDGSHLLNISSAQFSGLYVYVSSAIPTQTGIFTALATCPSGVALAGICSSPGQTSFTPSFQNSGSSFQCSWNFGTGNAASSTATVVCAVQGSTTTNTNLAYTNLANTFTSSQTVNAAILAAGSSVTASAFFGDGSHLTGIATGGVFASSGTNADIFQFNGTGNSVTFSTSVIMTGTTTVQGNAFSVGGGLFVVAGNNVVIGSSYVYNSAAQLGVYSPGTTEIISQATGTLTSSVGVLYAESDPTIGGVVEILGHGSNRVVSRYGLTLGGWGEILDNSTGNNGLVMGTLESSQPLVFGTDDVERMRISGAGNVGIGTTNPDAILDVNGAETVRGNITGAVSNFDISQSVTNSRLIIDGSSDQGGGEVVLYGSAAGVNHGQFVVSSSSVSFYTLGGILRMVIDGYGNVGIGTTSPGATLEVNGSALFDTSISVPNSSATASAFFGDGSHLTGIVASGSLPLTGGTMTGAIYVTSITASNETTFNISGSSFTAASAGTTISLTATNGSGNGNGNNGGSLVLTAGNANTGPGSGTYSLQPGGITLNVGTGGGAHGGVACFGPSWGNLCNPAISLNGSVFIASTTGNSGFGSPTNTLVLNQGGIVFTTGSDLGIKTSAPTSALSVYGVITSSTPIPSVSCTAGSPTMTAGSTSEFGSYAAGALATGCTVTFATAFPNAHVFCQCQASANLLVYASASSATAVTCTSATAMTGDTITYSCQGGAQ